MRGKTFTGLAAVFGKPSEDLGGFIEYIDRRAFDEVLATNPDVVAVWNHRSEDLLGRTSSGTLRLWTSDEGLHYELDPPDTTLGRDLRELLKRKDVTGSSFSFTVKEQEWEKRDGIKVRTVKSVGWLGDVSLVTIPAYSDSTVALRSLEAIERETEAVDKEDRQPSSAYKRSLGTGKAVLARASAEITRLSGG